MIYFIECMGFVKIGKAENVELRLRQLQVGNQHELRLLGVIDAPDDEEARLHAAFGSFHYRGEWFHLTKAIQEFIDQECVNKSGLVMGECEDKRTGTEKKADAIADILKEEFQRNGGCPIGGSTIHSLVRSAGFSVGGALYLAVERSGIRIEKTPAMTTPNLWHAPPEWLS